MTTKVKSNKKCRHSAEEQVDWYMDCCGLCLQKKVSKVHDKLTMAVQGGGLNVKGCEELIQILN